MRTLLWRRLAPLFVLVALLATGCGAAADDAAVVNGKAISDKSVTDELKLVTANSSYRAALEQSYGGKLAGAGTGTFDNAFVSQFLSISVYYKLIEQALAKDHVKVTADDESKAATTVDQQLSSVGKDVAKHFSAAYRHQLAHQEAIIEVAGTTATAKYLKDTQIACVSHILISTANQAAAAALAKAEAVKAQLDAGTDFATLAKTDSDDTGSKDAGGDLQCGPKGRFVQVFDDAVFRLPIGKVSDPVKSSFGYHLILVKSRRSATEADLNTTLQQQALSSYVYDVVCGNQTSVSINPHYGTWDTSPCKGRAGLARVAAPKSPKSSK